MLVSQFQIIIIVILYSLETISLISLRGLFNLAFILHNFFHSMYAFLREKNNCVKLASLISSQSCAKFFIPALILIGFLLCCKIFVGLILAFILSKLVCMGRIHTILTCLQNSKVIYFF